MENKQQSRPSSVPPKGPANDNRKENAANQKHRYKKRYDSTPRARNEQASGRKFVPQQKSRDFDKRPRSRGYYNEKSNEEVTQEMRAEPGSALCPGSKKGNLNHLLNFTFAPRDSKGLAHDVGWNGKKKWLGKSALKYSKEKFLQANCQFVVRENVDYSKHSADPDTLVDWTLIEQVRIFSHDVLSCPICLYPPTAAKMTRCGHIYCFGCILHYLHLEDKSWKKCPICYEPIHARDLKSVTALETHQYSPGEQITMKLMRRDRGSTYAMPRIQWLEKAGKPHYIDDLVDVRYAKLLAVNSLQIRKIVVEERLALEQQLKEEGDSLEGSFVKASLEMLQVREDQLSDLKDLNASAVSTLNNSNENVCPDEEINDCKLNSSPDALSATVGTDLHIDSSSPKPEFKDEKQKNELDKGIFVSDSNDPPKPASDIKKKNQQTDTYYFYQADDGQHLYLHSINARCMLKEYGSWETCPDTITATIVEMVGMSMTEELRRRLRYLNHLPLTCELQVLELAIKPPVVSNETLRYFSEEIDKRHRSRQKKHREEHQQSRKIREAENRKMGFYPGMRVNISSQSHFPHASFDSPPESQRVKNTSLGVMALPSTSFESLPDLDTDAEDSIFVSPRSNESTEDRHEASFMSFAEMLRAGKAKCPVDVGSKMSRQTQPEATGVKMVDNEGSDCEDYVPVPVFQSSFGDAIEQALDKYNKHDVDLDKVVTPSCGKKKKGSKQKLLFTTTMRRY